MNEHKLKLSLYSFVTYQIVVPGHLDDRWSDMHQGIQVSRGSDDSGRPITILTGEFDQAGLHSLLRRLYANGLPLISVSFLKKMRG